MKTLKLLNYAFDQWAPGEGSLAEISSAIDGSPVALTGSGGLDFGGMLRHAREVGGPAHRKKPDIRLRRRVDGSRLHRFSLSR